LRAASGMPPTEFDPSAMTVFDARAREGGRMWRVRHPKHLHDYASDLFERRASGIRVPRVVLEPGGWQPSPRCCHVNIDYYCDHYADHRAVRGWLFFDYEYALGCVSFLPHLSSVCPAVSWSISRRRSIRVLGSTRSSRRSSRMRTSSRSPTSLSGGNLKFRYQRSLRHLPGRQGVTATTPGGGEAAARFQASSQRLDPRAAEGGLRPGCCFATRGRT